MKLNRTLLLIPLLALSSVASAQLAGSDHDFTNDAWNNTGEMCVPCHTPHGAPTGVAGFTGLLWNHTVTSATFQMYTSLTLDGAIDSAPTGASLLCLSCHDGTVGLGDFGGQTGTAPITGNELIGTDLRGEHPISVVYDPVADTSLHPTSNTLGGGQSILSVLEGGKLTCASCHDVHNSPTETFGSHLLRDTMAGSALCLDCHNM